MNHLKEFVSKYKTVKEKSIAIDAFLALDTGLSVDEKLINLTHCFPLSGLNLKLHAEIKALKDGNIK